MKFFRLILVLINTLLMAGGAYQLPAPIGVTLAVLVVIVVVVPFAVGILEDVL